MRSLRVWGGNASVKSTCNLNSSNQTRCLIAATTKKRAKELAAQIRLGASYFDGYWCETGNWAELQIANEEGIWINEGTENRREYRRHKVLQ